MLEVEKKTETKIYDLEKRTLLFAKNTRKFVKTLPSTVSNPEDIKQLVKASSSVGANYIEANEALGKKDFQMRIKICKKETKEAGYWLQLLDCNGCESACDLLQQENRELACIFGAMLRNSES